jgi:tetratricopeptide (TPR) repeat protein
VKLAGEVRRDLLGLRKEVAEDVSRHLVAAGSLLDEDPERALVHARYARGRASRLAVVREAVGLAAYRAGEWAEAIAELRAARRMGGGPGHLAVLADCERALGRPERALELARSPEVAELDEAEAIELRIVAAGARRDMGEVDAAVVSLRIPELDPDHRRPWSARLFYAYADALLAAGRRDEAVRWFLHAADADDDELTDAADRLGELTEPGERPDVAAPDEPPDIVAPDEPPDIVAPDEQPEVGEPHGRAETAEPHEPSEAIEAGDEHPELAERQPSPTSASGPVS